MILHPLKSSPAERRSPRKSSPAIPGGAPKVLLVQLQSVGTSDLHEALQKNGFEVMVKSTLKESISCIASNQFSALICDLHLPAAGDGFTLVNAMRHVHPDAITMIMSEYPALRESLSELLPQADEVLVTPIPARDILSLLKARLKDPKHRALRPREPVATILERHSLSTIQEWITRVNKVEELIAIKLSDNERKGHLGTLLNELIHRLREPRLDEGRAKRSRAAEAHGMAREQQGYSASMLVEESRILQVCIFKTLRNNLNAMDLALVLTDVMTIADEVDSQLTQTMESFSKNRISDHLVEAIAR